MTATRDKSIWNATLLVALATIAVCDIAFGLSLQLMPLLLEDQGISASTIGAISAMGALGILAIGPFLPAVIAQFGSRQVAFAAIILIILSLIGMATLPPLPWWFALRFVLGLAIGTLFTVSETWMLSVSNENNRGRIMGIYTAVLSVTFATGPMIIPLTGIHGLLPWLICMVCVGLGLIPLAMLRVREIAKEGGQGGMLSVIRRAPILFASIAAATLFDAVYISFFTIFATRKGVPLETASVMLGFGIIAGVVFFYPLGLWADRWSKSGVALLCAAATILAALALLPAIGTALMWPLVVLLTTAAFGVYVVALAVIGDVFKGRDMVTASATVAAMWGVGGLVGPPIAGFFIDGFGINAFPWVIAGFYILLTLALLSNRGRIASTSLP